MDDSTPVCVWEVPIELTVYVRIEWGDENMMLGGGYALWGVREGLAWSNKGGRNTLYSGMKLPKDKFKN